ncbi:hypothetical protein V8C35DRAFT_297994 [Trichoderma chlorosporum]
MLTSDHRRRLADRSKNYPPWSKWHQPGSQDDAEIYLSALQKCKDINDQLNSHPWRDNHGLLATAVVESAPILLKKPVLYDVTWVEGLIAKEGQKVKDKQASKPQLLERMDMLAKAVVEVARRIKPIIDILLPQSYGYSVPYACLWLIYKGISDRKDKIESVLGFITSLAQNIPIFEAYGDMFPTDDMKHALAEFYIHTLDLLWRLSEYYSHNFFRQLTDAILPRTKFRFPLYLENVKAAAKRLGMLCETGHIAEQKHVRDKIEVLDSEVRLLQRQLQMTSLAQSRHYSSELIDTWHDDVGDVENEFHKWQTLRFFTDMRDHWSQNGIISHVTEWRRLCDNHQNSILWISSEGNGRQFWLTEFSVDLIGVCRSQGQSTMFAMCDRPDGVRWTPQQVLKQLISQLLNSTPSLTVSAPDIFNARKFRRATTFDAVFSLLHSILAIVGSVVVVIDSLDKCAPDPNDRHVNMADALSMLVKMHPSSLRIIVTTRQAVPPSMLPGLPISFAVLSTRRRPRNRYPRSRFSTIVERFQESFTVRVKRELHSSSVKLDYARALSEQRARIISKLMAAYGDVHLVSD